MGRSLLMRKLRRVMATAHYAEHLGISNAEAKERIERGMEQRRQHARLEPSRRAILQSFGAAALLAPGLIAPRRARAAKPSNSSARVAIVGAGMGGLSCAYELLGAGVAADVYEARERVGGRMYSLGGAFPGQIDLHGQVSELGAEFIDTLHTTMLGYAREFDLELEDVLKEPGEEFFYIQGVHYTADDVVASYRALVDAMRDDNRNLGSPVATAISPAEAVLDYTNMEEYLVTRGADDLIANVIREAYRNEYGLDVQYQSCINLLGLIHADRRSHWQPWGVFSDERYHVIGGNQQIPERMADAIGSQLRLGHWLEAASRLSDGRYRLSFAVDHGPTVEEDYDFVVFATPFTTLRNVHLDASLGLPATKTNAIQNLQYGTNSKMLLSMTARPWAALGGNGAAITYGLANANSCWESNPTRATSTSAVLIDYSGGTRGANLDPNDPAGEATRFLADLENVFPGVSAAVRRDIHGNPVAQVQNWSMEAANLGAYTCNQPGYYSTIADYEGERVDNLLWVGEHCSSFWEWQGWMEGAAVTGVTAAGEILADLRSPKSGY